MWRAYYQLAKPGVTFGNALSAIAGFLLASNGHIDWLLFLWLSAGTTLVIASACVLNNYLDQDIDSKMERTKKRADLIRTAGATSTLLFAVVLGVIGFGILSAYTNQLTVLVEIIGYVDYVLLYGMLAKRRSIHGTLVGSISGAAPILAGYVAASGAIDLGAILVFLIIFVWQMPEFYSISIYRRREYAAAGLPVMGAAKGVKNTTIQIFFYTILFVVFSLLLTVNGYTGVTYTVFMSWIGIQWLWIGLQGFRTTDPDAWARRMFKFSLVALLTFCALICLEAWLP